MGVRGLTTYVEQYAPNVSCRVSIPEMAARYRGNSSTLPVLLIDGLALLRKLYQGALDWIYGGQWREFVALVERFVSSFRRAGVELVFIFDGSVEPSKRSTWLERRKRMQAEIKLIFENIVRNHQQPPASSFQLPAALATMIRFLLKYNCQCEVHSSLVDGDLEVARMAKERNDCFAVLSEDTDFLIFDTKPYLSVKHLNLDSLHTIMYCRDTLASTLHLDRRHFPLFSCLMGNDIISYRSLERFHQCLTNSRRPSFQILPVCVARFIAGQSWSFENLEGMAAAAGISSDLLREGINSYSLNQGTTPSINNSDRWTKLFCERHVECVTCPQVYVLLVKREYGLSECLEDTATTGLQPSCLWLKPMRQRWYCLLTGESVTEWHTYSGQLSNDPVVAEPMDFGKKAALDWKRMWSDCHNDEVVRYRWEIFLSCLGVNILPEKLRSISPGMAAFAIILNYYLLHSPRPNSLTEWEINALLVQAISPLASDLPFIGRLRVEYVDERAVHISSLVLRALVTVLCISQCCCEPLATRDAMPWNFFDGKFFHLCYLQAKGGATLAEMYNNNNVLIKEHHKVYHIITDGTYLHRDVWQDAYI